MKSTLNIGFLYTSHCNAKCMHCSTDCGPKKRIYLDENHIFRTIEQAAILFPDRLLHVSFSGGEPFLDFELLCRLVSYAREHAAETTCVTNAHWAINTETAHSLLEQLKLCGLSGLAVSASEFHEPFIPPIRVATALSVARKLGLRAILKYPSVANGESVKQWAMRWGCDLKDIALEEFPIMPHLRTGEVLPSHAYQRTTGIPTGACPATTLTYRESGDAFTCCTPGGFVDSLKLGNIKTESFETIFNRFAMGGLQQILRTEGPSYFIPHVLDAGYRNHLRDEYDGVCDLCTHMFADAELAEVCERVALEQEIETLKGWLITSED